MALCFPCFTVRVCKDFRVATVEREKNALNPAKAAPTGRPTLLTDVAIEVPPVITADIIKPVSTIPVIIFLWCRRV